MRLKLVLISSFVYFSYCTAASITNSTDTIVKKEEEHHRHHHHHHRHHHYRQYGPRFRSVFAFGDSLTDNNAFEYLYNSRDVEIDITSLHPNSTKKLKRYSNGPLWIEYLADLLDHADLYNFARTAATVNNSLVDRHQIPDIIDQVNRYITSKAFYKHQREALHLIWAGGNDLNDIFKLYLNDGNNRTETIDGIISSLFNEVEILQATGAKYIILMNVNPIQEIPDHYHQSAEQKNQLKALIYYFNAKLKAAIETFQVQQENTNDSDSIDSFQVAYFDTYQWFESSFPADILAVNDGKTCQEGNDCGDLIWWDILHFTTKVYSSLAQALFNFILCKEWLVDA
ncbi:hypothetical protein BDF20DRAFT_915038 [Mycotypha africana]|uniref:uncharacterized protein n=1 Tax=Mycotypha africana TaxID=64632 RepID=UPI0023009289|nr:uncharacterized protein BDF20DRAFT_915038 [Mycotypha africana]KAI8973622.1 hypothetical protein BDF20DRAFT_915038 [Mycotypha africana]